MFVILFFLGGVKKNYDGFVALYVFFFVSYVTQQLKSFSQIRLNKENIFFRTFQKIN